MMFLTLLITFYKKAVFISLYLHVLLLVTCTKWCFEILSLVDTKCTILFLGFVWMKAVILPLLELKVDVDVANT